MYIYVIRHGQTDWNIDHQMLTITDMELNETGIEQCVEAEKLVKNLNYDLVICSPLKRTRKTAEIVNSKNMPVVYDDRLIERNGGSLEGKPVAEIDYKSFWTLGKDDIFDSETIESVKTRVYEFLDELKNKEEYKDKNILLVTHNGICRVIKTYFNGFPRRKDIKDYGQTNCEIKMYELK